MTASLLTHACAACPPPTRAVDPLARAVTTLRASTEPGTLAWAVADLIAEIREQVTAVPTEVRASAERLARESVAAAEAVRE